MASGLASWVPWPRRRCSAKARPFGGAEGGSGEADAAVAKTRSEIADICIVEGKKAMRSMWDIECRFRAFEVVKRGQGNGKMGRGRVGQERNRTSVMNAKIRL